MPVFTAAVGNGTSPLTVPAEDGRKLAYFFTEHADAAAFLRAVKANAGADLGAEFNAQVIGVSLADIIKAYSSPEAKGARETFVLIPTMAEVAAARQLMRAAGNAAAADGAELGPGSGLVRDSLGVNGNPSPTYATVPGTHLLTYFTYFTLLTLLTLLIY